MVNQQHENHNLYLHLPPTVSSASVQVTVYNMCPTQGSQRPALEQQRPFQPTAQTNL